MSYNREIQLKANIKWRQKHHSQYNEYQAKYALARYYENQEQQQQKSLQRYYYKKANNYESIAKTFRKILL